MGTRAVGSDRKLVLDLIEGRLDTIRNPELRQDDLLYLAVRRLELDDSTWLRIQLSDRSYALAMRLEILVNMRSPIRKDITAALLIEDPVQVQQFINHQE